MGLVAGFTRVIFRGASECLSGDMSQDPRPTCGTPTTPRANVLRVRFRTPCVVFTCHVPWTVFRHPFTDSRPCKHFHLAALARPRGQKFSAPGSARKPFTREQADRLSPQPDPGHQDVTLQEQPPPADAHAWHSPGTPPNRALAGGTSPLPGGIPKIMKSTQKFNPLSKFWWTSGVWWEVRHEPPPQGVTCTGAKKVPTYTHVRINVRADRPL